MPKKEQTMTGAVRVGSKVFTPGMEEELSEALDAETAKRLTERGVIEGFSTGGAPKAESETQSAGEANTKQGAKK